MASSSQRIHEDEQDFADRTVAWFEKLFPIGTIINAIFAGVIPIAPGAGYYQQGIFASIGSLLFMINMFLCAAWGLTTFFNKPKLKATLRAGGMGKVVISSMSLQVQLLFLAGMMFFFLVMNSRQLAQGIVGMVFTGFAIVAAIWVWVVQLKNSDKGISLTEEG